MTNPPTSTNSITNTNSSRNILLILIPPKALVFVHILTQIKLSMFIRMHLSIPYSTSKYVSATFFDLISLLLLVAVCMIALCHCNLDIHNAH